MVTNEDAKRMDDFVEYVRALDGYEKGEAQVFCDRLFRAFGHAGYKEAGAQLESRVPRRQEHGVRFVDLVWRPIVLVEMKSRGESLATHYRQAFNYWIELVPDRPKYVILCNFDEFWVYDFNYQLDSPVDRVSIKELPDRYMALNFLFPDERKPLFNNDKVKVTREAADKVAGVFNSLVARGTQREVAQRFVLQCVVAMFSEDFDLLPKGFFSEILSDCLEVGKNNSYDLIGGLFRQMAQPIPAKGGRFKSIDYFNGGLFSNVEPVELTPDECKLLFEASAENWRSVAPPIFGTIFQGSMDADQRHAQGAHFTSEADILKVVLPSIVEPWQEAIRSSRSLGEYENLLQAIRCFKVLDPACGSGNFLYVAFRELVAVEMEILRTIHTKFGHRARKRAKEMSLISPLQFFGIDRDLFAVELAKVTLMIGKRIVLADNIESPFAMQIDLPIEWERPLPLDNLDKNIVEDDALFCAWPKVNAIIGNPPFQSKNKMQKELGREYVNRLRAAYPNVPGRADYCVYWFRRTHDELCQEARAGLVGTNTVRQNYSREGGLEYITRSGGTITNAVASQVWSGDAVVHVSIVNWIKGPFKGKKKLFRQVGDHAESPWEMVEVDSIASTLSFNFDVSQAVDISANKRPKSTYQGQTHGHSGFLLSDDEANEMIGRDAKNKNVIFPYLGGEDLLSSSPPMYCRYVIDFQEFDVLAAQSFHLPFERVKHQVLPIRIQNAKEEEKANENLRQANPAARGNRHHENFLNRWWRLSYGRKDLIEKIQSLTRYIVCVRTTRRPVFVFVGNNIRPNDSLQVFAFDDDYSFGILQSALHWSWFMERCSTLKTDFRYTSNTVYNTFPWPQNPGRKDVISVVHAARQLRDLRRQKMLIHGLTLRDLYRSLEQPGNNPLRDAHEVLDRAVRDVYGIGYKEVGVEVLFELNNQIAQSEASSRKVVGPGPPLNYSVEKSHDILIK